MDEDIRSQRIGVLCMEKTLTPALTQALFRVKEEANEFHKKRIDSLKLSGKAREERLKSTHRQLREVKWSSLNLMRSFIANSFIEQFFHYWGKGPLPIMFFNTPFINNHKDSIIIFFDKLKELKVASLKNLQNSSSVFFLDTFTTTSGYRFEEKVRNACNLARCFRIDSRAHDIMQLADILLGITVFNSKGKKTNNKSKLRVLESFEKQKNKIHQRKTTSSCEAVYYIEP
ncbi:MAG: hypothetical protein K9L85_03555 [Candidatus Peribacteraceae bacterium]|nr:hypothetical protein [Candidatus Peribacteraceae bacterium]